MQENNQMSIAEISHNWRIIATIVMLFVAITFFVSTIIPPHYKSETQILILQKNMDVDAYRAAKSSEFAGEVLQRVVGSSDFMNAILEKSGISHYQMGETQEEQITNWNDAVSASTYASSGVVKITVLDESKAENKKLTEAVIDELSVNGEKYHGNSNITLKKIGGPVYFDNPAYPIIWLNMLVAGVVGLFFSLGIVFIFGSSANDWLFNSSARKRKGEIIFNN